jgi:hypothetical protein
VVMVAAGDCRMFVGCGCLQQTVAGCSAGLGYSVQYIVGRWCKRLLWFTDMAARFCARVKQGGEVDLVTVAWLIDGVLGKGGNIAHHPDGDF